MTPKEYLRQLYYIKAERRAIQAEIDELAIIAGRGTSTYGARALGGTDRRSRVEMAVIHKMDCEARLREKIAALDQLECVIIDAIDRVPTEPFRTVLWCRYVRCMSWDDICRHMGYERTSLWKLHGRALQKINVPVDKCEHR